MSIGPNLIFFLLLMNKCRYGEILGKMDAMVHNKGREILIPKVMEKRF